MSTNGLLIDYEYCTGCHACEVACKVEKGLEEGQFGIKLAQIGPEMIDEENEKWDWDFVPMPTKRCDLCADRTKFPPVSIIVNRSLWNMGQSKNSHGRWSSRVSSCSPLTNGSGLGHLSAVKEAPTSFHT